VSTAPGQPGSHLRIARVLVTKRGAAAAPARQAAAAHH
jgi:hypothetical protein